MLRVHCGSFFQPDAELGLNPTKQCEKYTTEAQGACVRRSRSAADAQSDGSLVLGDGDGFNWQPFYTPWKAVVRHSIPHLFQRRDHLQPECGPVELTNAVGRITPFAAVELQKSTCANSYLQDRTTERLLTIQARAWPTYPISPIGNPLCSIHTTERPARNGRNMFHSAVSAAARERLMIQFGPLFQGPCRAWILIEFCPHPPPAQLPSTTLPAVHHEYGAPPAPVGGGSGGSSSSSSAAVAVPSAPPSTANQINVDVAAGGNFVFNPANFTASNGTMVTFFFPNTPSITHSVTQSSFANPCTPLQASGSQPAGFDSGLQASKQFTIQITDDSVPIWFFCKQVTHCGLGMVGSINAPATGNNTFDAFKAAAVAIGSNEKTVQDSGPVTGGVNAVASATPANTVSASGASTSGGSSGSSSDATKLAASGVFGIVALVAALYSA
ncbi:hypothetical protein EVG20_g1255 [Dentipellis fragilis]|uniref:Blue (type 1) copper domain-containing protein n=1 Tax=Dentipellis fragilis TaxID=205917 RepID=A0A4Y9ZBC3_9AGAM|nr:hypothetical protein EVG20_g1255 [Dentipellis fragilis]